MIFSIFRLNNSDIRVYLITLDWQCVTDRCSHLNAINLNHKKTTCFALFPFLFSSFSFYYVSGNLFIVVYFDSTIFIISTEHTTQKQFDVHKRKYAQPSHPHWNKSPAKCANNCVCMCALFVHFFRCVLRIYCKMFKMKQDVCFAIYIFVV